MNFKLLFNKNSLLLVLHILILDFYFQYMKKLQIQERVVDEVKLAIKPFYSGKKIDKNEYKEILRKAVPKVSEYFQRFFFFFSLTKLNKVNMKRNAVWHNVVHIYEETPKICIVNILFFHYFIICFFEYRRLISMESDTICIYMHTISTILQHCKK